MLEELNDALSKDPTIKKYWGKDNIVKAQDAFRSLPDKARITLVEYLLHAFGGTKYFTWCCEYLKWIVGQSNQKERIEQALKCLVPELIGRGYSSQYILLNMSEKYRKRVDWHLSRIYRTRNALVHSGDVPRYIRYLGEHLHYYLDLLMLESFEKLSCGVQFCELDNALLDSLLACEILKKQLSTKEKLKADDIQTLVTPIFTKQDEFEYTCNCEP